MSSDSAKRARVSRADSLPSSLVCTFVNSGDGSKTPPLDLPIHSNTKQLEALINSLLNNNDKLPYAFYIRDIEIVNSLDETLSELITEGKDINVEDILSISYQPLSVFRVRPVTRCSETMPGHTDAVLHVSYSPDGERLASGGGGETTTPHYLLLKEESDTTVRFWNVTSSMPQHTCSGHKNHVLCTAWAPNGQYFVSADLTGEIRIWDPKSGTQKGSVLKSHSKWVTSLSFEPLHRNPVCNRFASASKDHTIKIWNANTNQCETTISGHTDSVECIRWGGNGMLYSASRDRTIKVWVVDGHGRSQQKLIRTLTGHAHRINSLSLSCDYVLRTGSYELGNSKEALSLEDAQEKANQRYVAVVGTEGERLVSASDDFTLFMWKPEESKSPLTRMTGHQGVINHIAFSPNARFVASASFDKKVKLWCGRTGRFIATLNGHVGAVYQVAWSADSNYIVSASKDSTVKLWSVKSPTKPMHTLPGAICSIKETNVFQHIFRA